MKLSMKPTAIVLILSTSIIFIGAFLLKGGETPPSTDQAKTEKIEMGVVLDSPMQKRIGLELADTKGRGAMVLIPESAVIWDGGAAWVYIFESENRFIRKKVTPVRYLENRWMEAEGIKRGLRVVSQGAQILLSMELSSQFQTEEGD